ncbi:MAG: hypothetical protein Q4A09_00620 [Capnocytophaga felis]|nr:hypothetical protein [Capnocytophaga felis]
MKRIRAMLHDLTHHGIKVASQRHFDIKNNVVDIKYHYKFLNRLEGYINFVGQVRGKKDPTFLKFKTNFNNYVEKCGRVFQSMMFKYTQN